MRRVTCQRLTAKGSSVPMSNEACAQVSKHPVDTQNCNRQPCVEWVASSWSQVRKKPAVQGQPHSAGQKKVAENERSDFAPWYLQVRVCQLLRRQLSYSALSTPYLMHCMLGFLQLHVIPRNAACEQDFYCRPLYHPQRKVLQLLFVVTGNTSGKQHSPNLNSPYHPVSVFQFWLAGVRTDDCDRFGAVGLYNNPVLQSC